ncbi:MAG: BLUF domain-containing protein [Paracoccaceae bacterium]|nr:BLUF domain-containing protein [Paracoccaceae bacterium]
MINSKNVNIKHLIYFSKPTIFDETHTHEILQKSRENNQKHGITGSLVCRSDLYFQFLEGPIEAVDETFRRIKIDTRHTEIQVVKEDRTNRKLFASWAMREDPVHTWMWTREEIKNGLLTRISSNDAFDTFVRLSREVDQFIS